MIAIDRTRVAAPQIAPHFASFLLLAVIPYVETCTAAEEIKGQVIKQKLTIQLGDGEALPAPSHTPLPV